MIHRIAEIAFMHVGVVGINHKLAHLKLRELLATVCQRRFGAGCSSHGKHAFVLLSTCNRTEIYFSSEDLAHTHTYLLNTLRCEIGDEAEDFNQKLYSYFGYNCFVHLSRVAAGLDSAIVAETEIQGQVKSAYEATLEYNSLSCDLHFLFQKSLHIGKQVRATLQMGRGIPDLEHALLNIGSQMFPDFKHASILFVGASEINKKILSFFKTKGLHNITLCNRSEKQAEEFSSMYDIEMLNWGKLPRWPDYDWIVCGTKAPSFLMTRQDLPVYTQPARPCERKLIIDLSVPRNADPALARDPRITLLNIDQVNRTLRLRKQSMNHLLVKAEDMVEESAKRNMQVFSQKNMHRQRERERERDLSSSRAG